ncbi:unnamed protein product [Photorhabdus laumondii subsp. laumondii TTO1]|uniref:Photorhabdus luminescens subsp. laumondii TTO1 complete genome segment 7/17 n=1 Tax=Photorhabdus laumondii subsp. laumondii (strain DSM 15139 / CIP 105565 / TT01) TaxID=243265 RepID=Q7N5V6_PHOLL|nr:unnamed protein product [Photorhabdus laumondii subsp. laumondii TTO1]
MHTSLAFSQAERTLDGIVFHDSPLVRFPTIAGFNKIHGTISRFIHPFHTRERAFVHP